MDIKNEYKIIADYLRWSTNDDNPSEEEIIGIYGGGISNRIITDFENGVYLYLSKDWAIDVISIIDTRKYSDSYGIEIETETLKEII